MSVNAPSVSGVEGEGTTVKRGSAWISTRNSERAVVLQTYASDPKYKKYAQQVEKCLNSFDNVHEWADCIAFLKQLLKTFQSYMQFKEIPRKLIVAKRLSQCLNPALPTGVHQRALDVYSHILTVLGPDGLNRDLPLWSSGLFPFFEYAATSVKPTLLNIYDAYYLPLHGRLRPIMKSFILSLLPGLEEETGEFFEKVLSLLDRLSGTVSVSFFFQNIWLVMLTTPSSRGTSLNFLSRRLPLLNADEEITSIVGRDIGLMIRAFSAALEDENLLVRRGALDLLLQAMRIDSYAVRKAHADDLAILMRAASGVVLRRDLSLNRRLYSWLLGPEEKSDLQISYLKENALELLSSTLRDEMASPSGEYSESRPFKIFISLLDKWEIGSLLTETLVYDAFKEIKRLVEHPSESGEDLTMTASTLYEAVEPQIVWKHLLKAVFAEITGDGQSFEAIRLVKFILVTFSQDEEIQSIHLPVIFAAIADIVDLELQKNPSKASTQLISESLGLLEEMLQHIPQAGLTQRPEVTGKAAIARTTQRPYSFACTFFSITPSLETSEPRGSFASPFGSSFESFVSLSTCCARRLIDNTTHAPILREVFTQSLVLMEKLVARLISPVTLVWDPTQWLSVLQDCLEQPSTIFATVDRIVVVVVALHRNHYIEPRFTIDERPVLFKIVNKLLKYLQPHCAAYHTRAVNLIWSLQISTQHAHIEAILAHSMTSPDLHNNHDAYDAFGVFWRLTEDNLLPGFLFRVPMMIVLDTLKSDDPSLRRVGETWMRCSLKSYLRILDPILYSLLDPSILRSPVTSKIRGRELQGFLYERPFDQRHVNYLLDTLLSIIRFGGQGFTKTARSSSVRRSHSAALVQRLDLSGLSDSDMNYLDVLVEIALRFLQSEPKEIRAPTMRPFNDLIQSTSVELLQVIVARGEVDSISVETMEAIVIGKLFFSVHTRRLDLQNKLLHLLHSLISVTTAKVDSQLSASGKLRQENGSTESIVGLERNADMAARYHINPLLVQTLIDGVSIRSNQPVLQHWIDFILMAVPKFQPALHGIVTPLGDCLCRQTMSALKELLSRSAQEHIYNGDVSLGVTDAELIMLLNGMERMILLSLASFETESPEDESPLMEKSTTENSGLLGYVSNVFSSDTTQTNTEQLTARSPGYRSLDEGIRVLYSVWASFAWTKPVPPLPKDESFYVIFTRTRLRCRRVLEHLFRVHSAEVFESIVHCWSRDPLVSSSVPDAAFELVDVLLASAQNAVHMICESIMCRLSGISEKSKKQAINPHLTDTVLFRFLEQYLQRLEGPLAIQVWPRYLQLVKEVVSSTREFKYQNFPTLRCLGVLAEKVTKTTAIEDKRIRKDLQENYGKLLDSCVTFVGRYGEQSSWIRRSAKEPLSTNGRDSPIPKNDEKHDATSIVSMTPMDTPKMSSPEPASQVTQYLATTALPNLRRFLKDNDKMATACSNIAYYIINPALKGRTKPLDVDHTVISLIQEMARLPAALKAWRNSVTDLLNDNKLFKSNPEDAEKWRPIVKALFDSDKSAFTELLSRVTSAPSANIFTNREYEMLLRSLNVRRMSYVLFTGEKNHFLTQLPSIQEKLVDILRSVSSPVVQSEVFLCIRVLLCRLSPHNLTSFWPVVLTELYRIFEQAATTLPSDGSEDLQVTLAACKCLDLLLVLQTEEFQIHQWIFITDTIDAVYRPDDWFPEAMMDQLAEIAGSLPIGETGQSGSGLHHSFSEQRSMRTPLLNSVRQIESIRDLIPFFSNVSIASYESVYASGGNVDWEAVEKGIMNDMFEGR